MYNHVNQQRLLRSKVALWENESAGLNFHRVFSETLIKQCHQRHLNLNEMRR